VSRIMATSLVLRNSQVGSSEPVPGPQPPFQETMWREVYEKN